MRFVFFLLRKETSKDRFFEDDLTDIDGCHFQMISTCDAVMPLSFGSQVQLQVPLACALGVKQHVIPSPMACPLVNSSFRAVKLEHSIFSAWDMLISWRVYELGHICIYLIVNSLG